jgi:O-antigen/teichoic acid export membrane protein
MRDDFRSKSFARGYLSRSRLYLAVRRYFLEVPIQSTLEGPGSVPGPTRMLGNGADQPRSAAGAASQRLLRGGAWALLGNAVGRGVTLAASLVVARILGPSSFGKWGVTQSTVTAVAGITALGAALTAVKYVAQHRNTDAEVASGRATLALLLAGAGGLVGAIVIGVYAQQIASGPLSTPSLAPLLRLGAVALACGPLGGAQLGILTGLEHFRDACIVGVIRGVAVACLMIVGGTFLGVAGAVAGLSVGELIGVSAGHLAVHRASRNSGLKLSIRLALRERATLVHFSLPAFLAGAAVLPAMWFGQVALLRRPDGLVQAGYFAYAYRWYLFILFFTSALAPVGLSVITNLRATGTAQVHLRFLRLSLYVNLIMTAVPAFLVVVFSQALAQIGGRGYQPSTTSLIVLAIASLPTALNNVLGQAALSMDLTVAWIASEVALAVGLAAAAMLLVPSLGSLGLALAYLTGMTLTCVVLAVPVLTAIKLNRSRMMSRQLE